jgi:hypothetical protein
VVKLLSIIQLLQSYYISTTGEGKFPECQTLSESKKSGTWGSQSSPSVALGEELHLGKRGLPKCRGVHGTGEERHSGKAILSECNTQGRGIPAKENWQLAEPVDRRRLKNIFAECPTPALGEGSLFPECPTLALGEEVFFF